MTQTLDNKLDESLFFAGTTGGSTSKLRGMIKNNRATKQFDREKDYALEEIQGILQEEGVIGRGLLGKLHFGWLRYSGIEFEYKRWLYFKKQENGRYIPYYETGAIGF